MRFRWWWEDADLPQRLAVAYVAVCFLVMAVVVAVDRAESPREAPRSTPKAAAAVYEDITPVQKARETPRATRSQVRSPLGTTRAAKGVQVSHRGTQRASGVRGYAQGLVPSAQWACLDRLWHKESGWGATQVGPRNPDGRYPVGIPQLKGLKVTDPPRYQVDRGLAYIEHRYGSPCAAWAHSRSEGWY